MLVQKIIKWSKYNDQKHKNKRKAVLNYAKNDYKSNLALKKNKDAFKLCFKTIYQINFNKILQLYMYILGINAFHGDFTLHVF